MDADGTRAGAGIRHAVRADAAGSLHGEPHRRRQDDHAAARGIEGSERDGDRARDDGVDRAAQEGADRHERRAPTCCSRSRACARRWTRSRRRSAATRRWPTSARRAIRCRPKVHGCRGQPARLAHDGSRAGRSAVPGQARCATQLSRRGHRGVGLRAHGPAAAGRAGAREAGARYARGVAEACSAPISAKFNTLLRSRGLKTIDGSLPAVVF